MNTIAGLPVDGLDVELADTISSSALMSVIGADGMAAEVAVDGAFGGREPLVRLRLGAVSASVSRADFVRLLATELGLGQRELQPRRLADVEDQVEEELARREPVLVIHGADRMLTESLECLYSIWSRATSRRTRLSVVLTAGPRLNRILARPALASLNSCIFIRHRLPA
ncbi:AAA family ATPase [Streptomyces microflavus]